MPGEDQKKIRYTIPTDFTASLIEKYLSLNERISGSEIIEVYGALPYNITGHGRSADGLPVIDHAGLEEHIKFLHKNSISFNYLMSGILPTEITQNAKWLRDFESEMSTLVDTGIDSVTVTNDDLILFVLKNFPSLKVHISLIKGIDTPDEAKKYDAMKVSSITLNPHTINRKTKRITDIISVVSCEVRIYANISCIHNCPDRDKHYGYVSSHSRQGKDAKTEKDPFMSNCVKKYMREREALLMTPFIRPEDMPHYGKLGISVFKLSDRKMPPHILLEIAESYMEQKYTENLFDLIFHRGVEWREETDDTLEKKDFPVIDNNKLGELEFFKNTTTLEGNELKKFYTAATEAAVDGKYFWRS
ncbi:hypothetical protein ACFL6D_03130 [Spirochaetota bacterium]